MSGRIAGFGPDVAKAFSKGEKVVALLSGGGYAQQVAVPAEQVLRIPEGIDLVTAAGLPEVAATVYSNLFMTAQLQAGETVLIHGGTGGIGAMAVQLAKAFGATVAATSGNAEKVSTLVRVPGRGHRHQLRASRTSWRFCANAPAATGRTSSWTWSAPNTCSATLRRWQCMDGWW